MTHILFIPYSENNKFILKPEDYCMYNFGEIAQHGVGWVRSKLESLSGSADREKHQRKERTPKEELDRFYELINSSNIPLEEQEQYKQQARALGIQGIVFLKNEFVVDSPMHQYIDELEKEKHSEMRFGREVIFSEEEILKFLPITNMNLFKKDKGAVLKKKLPLLLHNFYFLKKRVFDKLVQKSSLGLAE